MLFVFMKNEIRLILILIVLHLILLFTSTCTWPRAKIAGDEYLLSPVAPGKTMTVPTSTKGTGSSSNSTGTINQSQQK
jgi:hypothetical protein